ncbi:MAG: hypothetical protein H6679_01405 [Epsilonproteobacteria bacterium]|nr:hypothetical protein [Campylobacterota bacterium]
MKNIISKTLLFSLVCTLTPTTPTFALPERQQQHGAEVQQQALSGWQKCMVSAWSRSEAAGVGAALTCYLLSHVVKSNSLTLALVVLSGLYGLTRYAKKNYTLGTSTHCQINGVSAGSAGLVSAGLMYLVGLSVWRGVAKQSWLDFVDVVLLGGLSYSFFKNMRDCWQLARYVHVPLNDYVYEQINGYNFLPFDCQTQRQTGFDEAGNEQWGQRKNETLYLRADEAYSNAAQVLSKDKITQGMQPNYQWETIDGQNYIVSKSVLNNSGDFLVEYIINVGFDRKNKKVSRDDLHLWKKWQQEFLERSARFDAILDSNKTEIFNKQQFAKADVSCCGVCAQESDDWKDKRFVLRSNNQVAMCHNCIKKRSVDFDADQHSNSAGKFSSEKDCFLCPYNNQQVSLSDLAWYSLAGQNG